MSPAFLGGTRGRRLPSCSPDVAALRFRRGDRRYQTLGTQGGERRVVDVCVRGLDEDAGSGGLGQAGQERLVSAPVTEGPAGGIKRGEPAQRNDDPDGTARRAELPADDPPDGAVLSTARADQHRVGP